MNNLSFSNEPAVWLGLVTAIIGLVVVFFPGLLTTDQQKAIVGLAAVAVPVILSFVTRSQVTPNAKVAPTAQNVVVAVPAPPTPVNPQIPPAPPAPGA
jgi:drug/metabolite transporter (DMT)-like permease